MRFFIASSASGFVQKFLELLREIVLKTFYIDEFWFYKFS